MHAALKRLLTAGAVLAMATSAAAAAEPVTLEVLHCWPSHSRFHEPIAAEFMKANPDITIVYRQPCTSYQEGAQSVMRDEATGQMPDVVYTGYNMLSEVARHLAAKDELVDLGPLMAAEGADWVKQNYADRTLALGQVDGVQVGLPFNASTPIAYYNLDLVAKAGGDPDELPATWDEVIDLARRIGETGDGADGISFAINSWDADWLWQAMVFQENGRIVAPDGKHVAFGDATGRAALDLSRRIAVETKMPFLDPDQSIQQFTAGKLGMFIGSTAEVRTMDQGVGDKFTFATGPYPSSGKEPGGLPIGGNAAMILTKDPAKQAAAWRWVKFVTGPEGQKIAVLGSGYMPTNLRTAEPAYLGDFYAEHPNWTTSMKQWNKALPWEGYPGNAGTKIWEEQMDVLTAVMRDQMSVDDGLKAMVEKTEALMNASN